MTARNCLLTTVLLFTGVFYVKAQDAGAATETAHVTAGKATYDHKIIAILPVRTRPAKFSPKGDSAVQELIAYEAGQSLHIQEALFNAITQKEAKLLVDVQDWRITDSLLQIAGMDLRKVNYLDKQMLARLLKVDALLVGALDNIRISNTYAAGTNAVYHTNRKKRLVISLFDGKTGDNIWDFEKELEAAVLFDTRPYGKYLDKRLIKAFIRKFPYTK